MEDLQVSLMNVDGFGIENMSSIGVVEVVDPEHDLKDPVVELTRPVAEGPGKLSVSCISARQCAAVRTQYRETTVPPQKYLPVRVAGS